MVAIDSPDEKELLRRSIKGDKKAFGQLVTRHMKRAYYMARTFTGSHEEALDLSQEAFVRFWRSLRKFNPNKDFFPYYYVILRNLSLNSIRNKRIRALPFSFCTETGIIDSTEDGMADKTTTGSEVAEMIQTAMDRIPTEDREIILLKDMHGHSYKEIAAMLSIPVGTVMSRLYTARNRFRQRMKEIGYEHTI
jgi:RNA polymerase sigma-70 factor, ECF subfamily